MSTREKDICKHIGLPPNPQVQLAYDAWQDAKEAEEAAGKAWTAAVDAARAAMPLFDRMVFAAYVRCACGAGMAYDPAAPEDPTSVFKIGTGSWGCSAIMLGTADKSVVHTAPLPFQFYEVKSERQPSANGATTRP